MACPSVTSGNQFLASTLAHLDCQAQVIGAYGYGALSDPASSVSLALNSLLVIFIALFGVRLLLGYSLAGRDGLNAALKLGIVLSLATSWPAWRVLGYDVVLNAPAQVGRLIGVSSGLASSSEAVQGRLQNLDDGVVAITSFGSGRLTGAVAGGGDVGNSLQGVALADETGFGWGRVLILSANIGGYAITRLSAGILLAIAPLMAGLLLFSGTLGLFIGWLRGLVFCALSALILGLFQTVELALMEPWITDFLARRDGKLLVPQAPTELMIFGLGFCALTIGALFLAARIAFYPHPAAAHMMRLNASDLAPEPQNWGATRVGVAPNSPAPSRAFAIAGAVSQQMRYETIRADAGPSRSAAPADLARTRMDTLAGISAPRDNEDVLGSSFRRTRGRVSASGVKRDQTL
ncbi:MAG: hypothetical protein RLY97_602 [Pseudomonadota bacterium]